MQESDQTGMTEPCDRYRFIQSFRPTPGLGDESSSPPPLAMSERMSNPRDSNARVARRSFKD
jgi:hypothetical protein